MTNFKKYILWAVSLVVLVLIIISIVWVSNKNTISVNTTIKNAIVNVSIKNFSFNPAQINIKTGDKVVWVNQDSIPHSIVINGIRKSETLSLNASFEQEFNIPGTYSYNCGIHPSMKGTVVVK
ncbi:MAG: cupredoxin domain-containing protein [Patescibacteria group bacterium]